jgi:hypothetical protein
MVLHNFIESVLSDQNFDKCDEDKNYMSMPPENPVEQSIDNNQLGHGSDMNVFRDSICNALMDKVEQYQCLMIIKYSKFKIIMNHVTGSRLDEQ